MQCQQLLYINLTMTDHDNFMSNATISESSAMWMNVHLNPFSIWNSYSFQTELPALLFLGLENEQ